LELVEGLVRQLAFSSNHPFLKSELRERVTDWPTLFERVMQPLALQQQVEVTKLPLALLVLT